MSRPHLQGWQPGSTPGLRGVCVKSCSSWLMYRFLMQPWKEEELKDWTRLRGEETDTSSGIPEEREGEEGRRGGR